MRRRVRIRKSSGMWWWQCTLCEPLAFGATVSWAKTLRNVGRHCERRQAHHRWVARTRRAS